VELRFDAGVVIERTHADGDQPATRPLSAEEAGAADRTEGLDGANIPTVRADQVTAAQQPELLARNECLGSLASGHLAGAGLDVWEQEPPPPTHPLLALPNVVATYHTAGVTQEARRNNATLAATQIVELLTTGQRPERLVNPDVWPRASERLAALGIRVQQKETS
jgi:hypothetical protein